MTQKTHFEINRPLKATSRICWLSVLWCRQWPFRCRCFFWQLFWWWQQPFWFEPGPIWAQERKVLTNHFAPRWAALFSIVSPTLFLLAGITHEVTNFTYNVFSQKEPKRNKKWPFGYWVAWTAINFEDYLLPPFSIEVFLWFMKKFSVEK